MDWWTTSAMSVYANIYHSGSTGKDYCPIDNKGEPSYQFAGNCGYNIDFGV